MSKSGPAGKAQVLLAAMSMLGLSVGVAAAAIDTGKPAAAPSAEGWRTVDSSNQLKMDGSNQLKGNQLKGNQIKGNQIKSNQYKENQSNQLKMNTPGATGR